MGRMINLNSPSYMSEIDYRLLAALLIHLGGEVGIPYEYLVSIEPETMIEIEDKNYEEVVTMRVKKTITIGDLNE